MIGSGLDNGRIALRLLCSKASRSTPGPTPSSV